MPNRYLFLLPIIGLVNFCRAYKYSAGLYGTSLPQFYVYGHNYLTTFNLCGNKTTAKIKYTLTVKSEIYVTVSMKILQVTWGLLYAQKVTSLSYDLCLRVFEIFRIWQGKKKDKTSVINDPLGQTHSLASSQHCFYPIFFVLKSGDGRKTCAKTMITAGRDCGSASWINKELEIKKAISHSSSLLHFFCKALFRLWLKQITAIFFVKTVNGKPWLELPTFLSA